MKRIVGVIAVLGTAGTIPIAAQARWDETRFESGTYEYRLRNDEEVSIVLGCHRDGGYVVFEFREALKDTERAMVRSIPGERRNLVGFEQGGARRAGEPVSPRWRRVTSAASSKTGTATGDRPTLVS